MKEKLFVVGIQANAGQTKKNIESLKEVLGVNTNALVFKRLLDIAMSIEPDVLTIYNDYVVKFKELNKVLDS